MDKVVVTDALPSTFQELMGAPAFLISVDQTKERFRNSVNRIHKAGFKNIQPVSAVCGSDAEVVKMEWAKHPPVPYDVATFLPGPVGCLLSHLSVLKKIVDENIPVAVIFEDDVLFHSRWNELAPAYYQVTPKSTDMIYMGHHCGNAIPHIAVYRVPVYCTHAYIVSQQGATRLYDILTKYPSNFTHQIDMMLVKTQTDIIRGESEFVLDWLVWNSEQFPDPESGKYIHPHVVHKDKGLVFQEWYH